MIKNRMANLAGIIWVAGCFVGLLVLIVGAFSRVLIMLDRRVGSHILDLEP